jgi:hypothetical protein
VSVEIIDGYARWTPPLLPEELTKLREAERFTHEVSDEECVVVGHHVYDGLLDEIERLRERLSRSQEWVDRFALIAQNEALIAEMYQSNASKRRFPWRR